MLDEFVNENRWLGNL